MAEMFDAYHKWLGIPPEEQPPDHYRLLGIQRFEANADVIERGADRQMTYLRSLTFAEHVDRAQKLLSEVSAARICLTSPDKKEAYDLQLREEQPTESGRSTGRSVQSSSPIRRPSPSRKAAPPAAPIPVRATDSPRAINQAPALKQASVGHSPAVSVGSRYRQRSSSWQAPVAIGVAILACVVVLMLVSAGQQPDENPTVTHKQRTSRGSGDNNRKSTGPKEKPAIGETEKNKARMGKPVTIEPGKTVEKKPSTRKQRQGKSAADSPSDNDMTGPPERRRTLGSLLPDDNSPDPTTGELDPPDDDDPFDPSPPDDPPPSEQITIPDAEVQETVEQQIRDLYAADFKNRSPAGRQELGKKLLQLGDEIGDDPKNRYVLLRMARDIAIESGDLLTAISAIDQLDRSYDIDALKMKTSVLTKLTGNIRNLRNVELHHQLAPIFSALIHQAIESDRFDIAKSLSTVALSSARKSKDASLVKKSARRNRRVKKQASQFEAVKEALTKLQTAPTDAAANLKVGKYQCFAKGNWELGLPFLAAGGEDRCAMMARKDLAEKTKDADAHLALGNAWWQLSEKVEDDEKWAIRARAAHWYRLALPSLPKGINRLLVERRLKENESSGPDEGNNAKPGLASDRISLKGAMVVYTFDKKSFVVQGGQSFTRDWSGNGFHGKLHGPTITEGVAGSALRFDGRNDALYPLNLTAALHKNLKEFSICGWVRPQNGGKQDQFLFNVGFWGKSGLGVILNSAGTLLSMNSFTLNNGHDAIVVPNQWSHFAAIWSDGLQQLYVNGKLKSEKKVASILFTRFTIGAEAARFGEQAKGNRSKRYFKGDLDEVVLFGRGISSKEVKALYQWGKAGRPLVKK